MPEPWIVNSNNLPENLDGRKSLKSIGTIMQTSPSTDWKRNITVYKIQKSSITANDCQFKNSGLMFENSKSRGARRLWAHLNLSIIWRHNVLV